MSLPSDDPNSLAPMLEKITDDGEREVYYYCDELGRPREVLPNLSYDEGQPVGYLYTLYTLDTVAQYCTRGWAAQVKISYMREEDEEWESRLVSQNDYTYSDAGQRLTNAVSDNNGPVRTEEYGYDRLYRLTGVDYGDTHTRAHAFDAIIPRTVRTHADGSVGCEGVVGSPGPGARSTCLSLSGGPGSESAQVPVRVRPYGPRYRLRPPAVLTQRQTARRQRSRGPAYARPSASASCPDGCGCRSA